MSALEHTISQGLGSVASQVNYAARSTINLETAVVDGSRSLIERCDKAVKLLGQIDRRMG